MTTAFRANLDYVPQVCPDIGVDYVVEFRRADFDIGGFFDKETHRYAPEPGLYYAGVSLNVDNPIDGGKYYALVRKNGDPAGFELLCPNRMSGEFDTVGTQTHGPVMIGEGDYLEFVFQQSNVPAQTPVRLNGQPLASWCYAQRIGDYVEPREVGIHGHAEVVNWTVGAQAIVDMSFKLKPGNVVEKLAMFSTVSGSYPLKIVRRNSAGNFDVVVDQSITHGGTGREHLVLSAPFTVPNDGKDYHLGAYSPPANHTMFIRHAHARAGSDISGNGVTMTEIAPTNGYLCLGVGVVYAP